MVSGEPGREDATMSTNRPKPHPRVAIILPRLTVNGVHKVHIQLASGFTAHGLGVDFVTSDPNGPMASELPQGTKLFSVGIRGKAFFFPDLLRYIKRRQPTHVFSIYEDVSIMVQVAKAILRADFFTLLALHNSIVEAHQQAHGLTRLKYRLIEQGIRRWYPRADAVVTVSHGLASELNCSFGVTADSTYVVNNPVIQQDFWMLARQQLPDKLQFLETENIIGFFGRLERQKNVALLIKAFALMLPEAECRLLIVGEGSEENILKEQASQLGISDRLTFHPFLSNPFAAMRRCGLVVLSSIYEGAPNVLIEAMACGTQVVSTNCDYGPAEILRDGRFGQLVPVGDADALATAMSRSITQEFFVPPKALIEEGMKYTAGQSVAKYLRIMGIPNRHASQ